jgi:hypothetical protein
MIDHRRHIPIDAIRDAAAALGAMRGGAVRLHWSASKHRYAPGRARSGSLPQTRSLSANQRLQIRRLNVVRQLTSEQLASGVWTVSAGNAALGVAYAARRAGARCSVMVSDTAPRAKLAAIERLGAAIVMASYDECWRTVEQHASDRMSGYFIHPFDDDRFIAGNGTAGLEIMKLARRDADVASRRGRPVVGHCRGGAGTQREDPSLCRGTRNGGATQRVP